MLFTIQELTCVGYKVTDDAVGQLCKDIKRYMTDSASTEEDKKAVRDVTLEHLLNWKVLKRAEGEILAANSFVLLTDDYFGFSKIQCALFKGTDRDISIDKKEYSGALYEQIEGAYQFVLRHINLSAEIEGIVRKDAYELPIGAIREMIVNAVCHRNYMDNSCVQVAVYDDRVEVSSPGMLYGGLTLEEAMSGRSKIRNRAIAEVFSRMEIIESWGTGIRRIMNRAKEFGLPEPEFLEIGDTFRVNLFRAKTSPKVSPKTSPKVAFSNQDIKTNLGLTKQQIVIIELMEANPQITRDEIARLIGKSLATVKNDISTLQKIGIVEHIGSSNNGEWVIRRERNN